MKKGVPALAGLAVLALLLTSSLAATPVNAQKVPPLQILYDTISATEPVWASVNAVAQGNYPGGNEIFDVFMVDSALPPEGNVTIQNETVSTTAWTGFNSNTAIGLPVILAPGQSILNTVALPIPSNFTLDNFTASLKAYVSVLNGTTPVPLVLTGSILVTILGLPLALSRTTVTSTSVVTDTQNGAVSTTLLGLGVAIPSVVAVLLLALLVRGRGKK